MKILLLPCLAVCAALLLNACATTGGYKVSKAAPPSKVTVAVKQFTTSGYAAGPAEDKGLADFEAIYLPTRLMKALSGSPGVSKA